MQSDLIIQLLEILDRMPDNFSSLPGEVFSTGTNSLRPGDLYILGLNPMFGTAYPTIRNHVANWSLDAYSAFTDQCWQKRCWNMDCYGLQENAGCNCRRGTQPHQRAVQRIVEMARPGQDIRTVFATNAIFASSTDADRFKRETGFSLPKAFDVCWPAHQFFLSHVQPKVILSLGYSQNASAFSLIMKKAGRIGHINCHTVPNRKYPSFKWCEIEIDVGEMLLSTLIIGIRHPSYIQDAADTPIFTELIASYIDRQATLSSNELERKAAQADSLNSSGSHL